jgi:hypothetical protein
MRQARTGGLVYANRVFDLWTLGRRMEDDHCLTWADRLEAKLLSRSGGNGRSDQFNGEEADHIGGQGWRAGVLARSDSLQGQLHLLSYGDRERMTGDAIGFQRAGGAGRGYESVKMLP